MIIVKKGIRRLVYNAESINTVDIFRLSFYNSFYGDKPFGFVKKDRHTSLIDLNLEEEELIKKCKSNTRNEIRRGDRDGYVFNNSITKEEFVSFYNVFADEKGLAKMTFGDLQCFDNLYICGASYQGQILTMHVSLGDVESGIVTLLYSASVRFQEGIDRKCVGISNRFLHYKEFLEFKRMGFSKYDFNGVCLDENKPVEYSIGQFKQAFGGDIVPMCALYSIPWWLAMKLKALLKK